MPSQKSRLTWACALSLLAGACSGSSPNYFAGDESAVQQSLSSKLPRRDPTAVRIQVGMPPANKDNRNWIEPFATGPLPCGSTRHELFGGDEYIIESKNYDSPPPAGDWCNWNFKVKPNVVVDLLCEQLQLPCQERHFLRVKQFNTKRTFKVCTNSTETVYLNQRIDNIEVRDYQHRLLLKHVTNKDGTRFTPGIGFRCVVRGTGGTLRPDATPSPPTAPPTAPPTPPDSGSCGIDASSRKGQKIINGTEATPHEYPWQIALRVGNSFCGGSIINSRWILTAAHCIAGGNSGTTFVYTGCHLRYSSCDPARATDLLIIDANYDGNILHDIGLVRLATPISEFNDRVQPICLPTASTSTSDATLWVSGWGKTGDDEGISSVLKEASVTTKPDQYCRNVYGSAINDFSHLCAVEDSGSTCSGDSGSFVGNVRNGVWEQDGIVSFGARESCSGYPMGFTELRNYVDWVLGAMAAFP